MPFSAFTQNTEPAKQAAADSTSRPLVEIIESMQQSDEFDMMPLINFIVKEFIDFAVTLALAVAVFIVGRWLLKKILTIVIYACHSRHIDITVTLFVKNLIQVISYIILILIAVQILGLNTSSLIAMLASAGLAAGMALSGTLQNFAGGVMLLILKPYKVGDYITTQGESGTVKEITLFTTMIETFDKHTIFIPNSAVSSAVIDNATYSDTRRVSITVSISYGASVADARRVIMEILKADSRVLTGEEDKANTPLVGVSALADSSVNIAVRAWVKTDDYWDVFFDLNEAIYETLPKRGIAFPFPQLDVHIKQES